MRMAHRIGAGLYVLWGIAHVIGGGFMWYALTTGGPASYLAAVATAVDATELARPVPLAAQSVLAFHAFNLLWLGALVIGIAAVLNWRNSVAGYWINLAIVSATDLGLIATMILPGYMNVSDGLVGPVLWAGAALFTTIGVLRAREGAGSAQGRGANEGLRVQA